MGITYSTDTVRIRRVSFTNERKGMMGNVRVMKDITKNETIENLNDLILLKNTKIAGLTSAVNYLKGNKSKVLRELNYLKSQYDSQVERQVVEKAIEIVTKIYE